MVVDKRKEFKEFKEFEEYEEYEERSRGPESTRLEAPAVERASLARPW
jgi:hypothetical protein